MSSLMNGTQDLSEYAVEHPQEDSSEPAAMQSLVRAAIGQLPDTYKKIMLLREVDRLPYDQIAVQTGLPVGTVKSRVNRGRALLHKKLHSIRDQLTP